MNGVEEIFEHGLKAAGKTAIALIGDGFSVTYSDLYDRARATGVYLRQTGICPGDRIIIRCLDSIAMVECILGAMGIGAVPIPINPYVSKTDFDFIVRDSHCMLIIVDSKLEDVDEASVGSISFLKLDDLVNATPYRSHQLADPVVFVDCRGDSPAFCLYTSGTTGRPKGVIHAHRNILDSQIYLAGILGVVAGQRIFSTSKLFFAYSLGVSIFGALSIGATTILHAPWPRPHDVVRLLDVYRPDYVFSVPKIYDLLLAQGVESCAGVYSVTAFISAGEKLPATVASRWFAAVGNEILDSYGTSETVYMILANSKNMHKRGSVGLPCPNVALELGTIDESVAADQGQEASDGEQIGVLIVRSRSKYISYTTSNSCDASRLYEDGFSTQDVFRRDTDGFYFFIGRVDDLIKRFGRWVAPTQIESCIKHKDIIEAALIGRPGESGLTELVLFVVKTSDSEEHEISREIMSSLRVQFSSYMLPDKIKFISELPRGPTGKLQRFKLRSL